jgi:hypothetical protein
MLLQIQGVFAEYERVHIPVESFHRFRLKVSIDSG